LQFSPFFCALKVSETRPTESSIARADCKERRTLAVVFQAMSSSPKALKISRRGVSRAAWLSSWAHAAFRKPPQRSQPAHLSVAAPVTMPSRGHEEPREDRCFHTSTAKGAQWSGIFSQCVTSSVMALMQGAIVVSSAELRQGA
jgi:hypothetical protein